MIRPRKTIVIWTCLLWACSESPPHRDAGLINDARTDAGQQDWRLESHPDPRDLSPTGDSGGGDGGTSWTPPAAFAGRCLSPDTPVRPAWECYQIPTTAGAGEKVTATLGDTSYSVTTFVDGGATYFRFTPSGQGEWTFSTGGSITINAARPSYAKGFLAADGQHWVRTANGRAFVPQFVMYDKSDIQAGLDELVEGHGFSGFHLTTLRDFLDDPAFYEQVVIETYRRGGVTHLWIWGDGSNTPGKHPVDVDELYQAIGARLGPLPGWSVGYGYDLWEWASATEIEQLRSRLHQLCDYHHMIGGRGHKNQYQEISPNLDYASWEWHRPTYDDYRDHLTHAGGRPAFSEDRFRIRDPSKYPEKDYDAEMTYRGLWDSMLAGGVANIWGHKPADKTYSDPYPNKVEIRTYSEFAARSFVKGMVPDAAISNNGYCLRAATTAGLCFLPDTDSVTLDLSSFSSALQVVAVDARAAYQQLPLTASGTNLTWQAPHTSDWAIRIVTQ